MKFIYRIILMAFLCMVYFPGTLFASHGAGGEITWECLGNGQYKFRFTFFRSCDGIPYGNSIKLTTTVPGVDTIPLSIKSVTELSPQGFQANGVWPCLTCASSTSGPGLMQKIIYESAPITLNGVPPPGGWEFHWGECCRSTNNNLQNDANTGFLYKAIMYPYNGLDASTCFDNSPYFVEKPHVSFCTGVPQSFTYSAYDIEGDSIIYTLVQPTDDFGTPVGYNPGYNVNSPFPSVTQNASNIPLVLNSTTGDMTYYGVTGGIFNLDVKATSYKCGIKVSEIFRELQVAILNNCPAMQTGPNTNPLLNPPFYNTVTGMQTEYVDTITAGELVEISLAITDFEIYLNNTIQNITISASGSDYGTNFTGSTGNCEIPPCPRIIGGLPRSIPLGGNLNFYWQTSSAHYNQVSPGCFHNPNVYSFKMRTCDNYCPANACGTYTFKLVLLEPPVLDAPQLRCATVNNDGSVTLNWQPTQSNDSLGLFTYYKIYTDSLGGGELLVDSIPGIGSTTYTHSTNAMAALGIPNGNQFALNYKITTCSGYFGGQESPLSNEVSSIKLYGSINNSNVSHLIWNSPAFIPLASHASKYLVYREYPLGSWNLIDSTANLFYDDSFTQLLCNDSLSYKITLQDNSGCILTSSVQGLRNTDTTAYVQILPANPAICNGQNTILNSSGSQSYLWSNGATTQSIAVSAPGVYTLVVTDQNGCTGVATSTVITGGSGPAAVITGDTSFCQGSSTTISANLGAYLTYLWNTGETTQTIIAALAGNYSVTVTDTSGCSANNTVQLSMDPNPVANINGSTFFCVGSSTTLSVDSGYTYQWSNGDVSQTTNILVPGNYAVVIIDSNGCTGAASVAITANPAPSPQISGDSTWCSGQIITLDVGAGYMLYDWSNGVQTQTCIIDTTGVYIVTVTDANGCTGTDSITINNSPVIPIVLTASGNLGICQGDSIQLSVTTPMSSYQWYKNNLLMSGATSSSLWVGLAGRYNCEVIDASGCDGISNQLRVSVICINPFDPQEKIQQSNAANNLFQVQPNPSSDYFIVQGNEIGSAIVTMVNVSGQLVSVVITVESDHQIIVSGLGSGVYFMKIETNSGTEVHKIVKIE